MKKNEALGKDYAGKLIAVEEALALHAYPDPLSPLGRALVKRFGPTALMRVAGNGVIPADLKDLKGHPWTIGYGETGADIVPGLVWTVGQAKHRLSLRVDSVYKQCQKIWPGIEELHPFAIAALISLVYNRGSGLKREETDPLDRRAEMRHLVDAIKEKDYNRMADLVLSMKRLWENQGVNGLLLRRDKEASMIRQAGTLPMVFEE